MTLNSATLRTVQGLLLHAREYLADARDLCVTNSETAIASRYLDLMHRIEDERRDVDRMLAAAEKAERRP